MSNKPTPQQADLAIIGSGPAGYTAAVYAARDQLKTVQFTGVESGGQLMYTTDIENFPGFSEGIEGPALMIEMRKQAKRFGTTIIDGFVVAVDFSERPFKLWTELPADFNPKEFESMSDADLTALHKTVTSKPPQWLAQTAIISTGAVAVKLGIPGEDKFFGRGVSSCAVCDAAFYREKTTYVVGGGDSAMEDSLALAKFADKVTVVHRRDEFRASKIMQQRVFDNEKIDVLWNSNVTAVLGEDQVTGLKIETEGEEREVAADGMFLAIGHKPSTSLFSDQLTIDEHGYIVTRQSLSKAGVEAAQQALNEDGNVAFPTMTSVPGVFAAGDVVDIRYKQAITAAGMGCAAALDAEKWLTSQQESN